MNSLHSQMKWQDRLFQRSRIKSMHLAIGESGKHIEGEALPLNGSKIQNVPLVLHVIVEGKGYGMIRCTKENRSADKIKDRELVKAIAIKSCPA